MNFNQRARADADAISLHESKQNAIKRDVHRLKDALMDFLNDDAALLEFARIAQIAFTDETECGRHFRKFAEQAVHECARWQMGDDAEAIEPAKEMSWQQMNSMAMQHFGIPQTLQDRVDGARGIVPAKEGAK